MSGGRTTAPGFTGGARPPAPVGHSSAHPDAGRTCPPTCCGLTSWVEPGRADVLASRCHRCCPPGADVGAVLPGAALHPPTP